MERESQSGSSARCSWRGARAPRLPVKRADAIGPCQTASSRARPAGGRGPLGRRQPRRALRRGGAGGAGRCPKPDGASLIEKVAHLSSVSGGSLAASYYVLKKPGRDVKVLNADGTLSDAYRAFFEQYRTDLSQDFETALIWRQLLSFRWVNSALAAQTLAEILASASRRRPPAGPQRAREGRRQPRAHHQHHALQQRPPPRADRPALGGVRLRLLRGSGAVARSGAGA